MYIESVYDEHCVKVFAFNNFFSKFKQIHSFMRIFLWDNFDLLFMTIIWASFLVAYG